MQSANQPEHQQSNQPQDQLHRYLFNERDIRGELVCLRTTWQQILATQHYPPAVKKLLGELLVATSLLTATLKFAGDISIQLQGDGPLSLLVIHGNHQQQMRGIARLAAEAKTGASIADNASLRALTGNGVMVITISPENGERYQGVVALEKDSIAACLEDYFCHSEQLATRLFIHSGEIDHQPVIAGILLQSLPAQKNTEEDLQHLAILTQTVTSDELCGLPARDLLWRLYHDENVTLYPPQPVSFHCTCSRQRCLEVLTTLPSEEIADTLRQQGHMDMHCDYCGADYHFTPQELSTLQ